MKKKFNFKSLTLPLFAVLSLNLIIALTASLSAYQKTTSSQSVATQSATLLATQPRTATQLFLSAVEKLNSASPVTITTTGEVNTFVNQKVYLKRMFNGSTHFTQSVTSGFKSAALRTYYTNNYDLTTQAGKKINGHTAEWNGKITNYNLTEYLNKYYLRPDSFFPYDISAENIISTSAPLKLNGRGYSFTVSLHPQNSTTNYAKQLQSLIKLNSKVNFESVVLVVQLNEDETLSEININENYTVSMMGLSKKCTSSYVSHFDFTQKVTLPIINEHV